MIVDLDDCNFHIYIDNPYIILTLSCMSVMLELVTSFYENKVFYRTGRYLHQSANRYSALRIVTETSIRYVVARLSTLPSYKSFETKYEFMASFDSGWK